MSTEAYVIFLGLNPVSWSSKKQRSIARPSTKAEYCAIASTTAEIQWVQSVIDELWVATLRTSAIYSDNVGATYLSANLVFDSRIKAHLVCELIQSGHIRVMFLLTKPLSILRLHGLNFKIARLRLHGLSFKIGVFNEPSSWGDVLE